MSGRTRHADCIAADRGTRRLRIWAMAADATLQGEARSDTGNDRTAAQAAPGAQSVAACGEDGA